MRLARLASVLLLVGCEPQPSTLDAEPGFDALPNDATLDAPRVDGSSADAFLSIDGAELDAPIDVGSLPPLRDDGLLPPWPWIEEARRAMDHELLPRAFAAERWAPPAGSEIYAARITAGAGVPAYVMVDAGSGAFSEDYWPASTVKVLSSLAALELLHSLGYTGQATVTWDSGFSDVARSIIDRAIRVSSNQDYDRTIRIAGFDWLNTTFLDEAHGFPNVVIQRSYAGFPIRDIPGMTVEEAGRSDYVPARSTTIDYGCGADGNCASLFELTEAVRRVMQDGEVAPSERFAIDPGDVTFVADALCAAAPSFFASGVEAALGHPARICHKPGWVPLNDCLDHGLVEDPASGERWLLAVSVPETEGRSDCLALGEVAEHVLRALLDATDPGMPLSVDAGIGITVQIDDRGPGAAGRRDHALTIDAPGADHVEVFVDRYPVGGADGGPRFSVLAATSVGGERLVVVRAFSLGTLVGERALRALFTAP